MAERKSRFVIDGVDYPIPSLDTFDMDEAQRLYDLSGLGLEDFAIPDEDEEEAAELERKLRNPGFVRALMEIAYQRGNPGVTATRVTTAVGRSNLVEAYSNWLESMVDDSPPAPARSEPEPNGEPARPDSSSESSGDASPNGSGQPDGIPESTGTTRSGTSSPLSAPTT